MKTVETYLEELRPIVAEMFKVDSGGHDLSHLERTAKAALYIQQYEGGDRVVIGIASFLHDVHRIMEVNLGRFVSPEESLDPIREVLAKVDLSESQIDQICYCVEHHEHYNWNGDNVDDLNTLVLQDADNLDAMGAIGIARGFQYGGANNMPLYDPSVPLESNSSYVEGKGKDASTLHHFMNKSMRLADNMNTETGRKLAAQRNAYMLAFIEEFLTEWSAAY